MHIIAPCRMSHAQETGESYRSCISHYFCFQWDGEITYYFIVDETGIA